MREDGGGKARERIEMLGLDFYFPLSSSTFFFDFSARGIKY